ncbi:C4-dicarboxylate ABC transporter [Streptomyces sp. NPDC006784]|uniref:SLAC1 family transporter n=1 Tax=Streptomyces sp. NPDC006784 TaxID=3364764 RepID=UPI00368E4C3C
MTASTHATAETDSPGSAPPAAAEHPPGPRLRALGPNWYAAVMGTAIVATAGTVLPLHPPRALLDGVWALAAAALAVLLAARGAHWLRHRDRARAHLLDPAIAPFYGCLAMALLAVGGGALALDVPGAAGLDAALWTSGTAVGLATAVTVPYLMITRHRVEQGSAAPAWLLPVVAPMVSAALGPPLAAHLPAGPARQTLLLGSFALFGTSLLATLLLLPLLLSRLLHHGPLPAALTPSLFLVLGPLGQSTTALGNLADAQPGTFGALSVLYGIPVLGFALLWLALSSALVVRAARRGMAFSLTWWAFTFPVGTCVTGAAAVWRHTGAAAFGWLAVGLYTLLVAAWAAAATGTVRGLLSGALLAAPHRAPAAPAPATARTR